MLRSLVVSFLAIALAACAAPRPPENAPASTTSAPGPDREAVALQPPPRPEATAAIAPPAPDAGPARAPAAPPAKGVAASVYFSLDTTEVDDPGMKLLLAQAARLKEHPRRVVTLVAYTETFGSSSYRLAVADEEINAVAALLRAFGVPGKQIRHRLAKPDKAAATCATPACRQKVRHVDLTYP